jgi:hypothetical protein
MITPITRTNMEMLELCRPGLQRELDRSDLKECWDMDALYDNVVNFCVFAFYQHESGLAGVVSANNTPKIRILNFFWTGKDPENKTPADYAELDRFLVHMAKELNCSRIVCDGREGWSRIVPKLGYSDSGRVYVKNV